MPDCCQLAICLIYGVRKSGLWRKLKVVAQLVYGVVLGLHLAVPKQRTEHLEWG